MKSALLTDYNKPLEMGDIPDPHIQSADDVIVKVGAAGICRTDLHMQDGQFAAAHEAAGIGLPFTCGHETAGWIAEVGPSVTHLKVGDPVLLHPVATCGHCHACRAGDDMHCRNTVFPGVFAPGGFAEYVRTSARALVPIPAGLQPADVASLACAGLTVYHAVKKSVPYAYPGSSTVILGAGGLGHLATQLMRALTETDLIVVDRSQAALDHAKAWGADHTVLAVEDGRHVAEVRALTSGLGAQVVFDCIGEHDVQNDAVQMLGARGIDLLIGYGGTLNVEILSQALFPETSFIGNICGTYNELVELLHIARRGSIKLVSTCFPMGDVNQAMDTLREGRIVGRGVLIPAGQE